MNLCSRFATTCLAVFAFSVVLNAAPTIELVAPAGAVAAYDFAEATLHVAGSEADNPFTDVSVTGVFGLAGEGRVAVDGFCDRADGGVFRIRFMPTKPGAYVYTVTYREGAFEQTLEGSFTATEGKRKGLLRTDPEFPAHFQWEGTRERFFWNGAEAFGLAGCDEETIRETVARFDRVKVTRLRAALGGADAGRTQPQDVADPKRVAFNLAPWIARNPDNLEQPDFDITRFNVAYWQQWERLLEETRRRDMVVSVVFSVEGERPGADPFGPDGKGGPDEQRYFRYAVARLGAYANVTWDLARDYRSTRNETWAAKMGALLEACDPYSHLTSVQGGADFSFGQAGWADFATLVCADEQGGYDFLLGRRRKQEASGRTLPLVTEKCGDANLAAPGSAAGRMRLAWQVALAGGYQTIGECVDSSAGSDDEAAALLERYGHLFDFFTSVTWWELQPDTELVRALHPHPANKGAAMPPPRAFAARNPSGDLAAIYVEGGGIVTLRSELLKDQLKPLWFSPRDGGMRNARALTDRVYRTPNGEDWVLLFRTPCNCSFRDFDNEFER